VVSSSDHPWQWEFSKQFHQLRLRGTIALSLCDNITSTEADRNDNFYNISLQHLTQLWAMDTSVSATVSMLYTGKSAWPTES